MSNLTDPLAHYAKRICEQCAGDAPDFSKVIVLLPDLLHAARLPRHFLAALASHDSTADSAANNAAIIPPHITTPRQLAVERDIENPPLRRLARHFRLGIALVEHPKLFEDINRWQLSDKLLALFDELHLRDEVADIALKSTETQKLLSLHRAWRDHLDHSDTEHNDHNGHNGHNDHIGIYRDKLINDTLTRPDEHVFLCGFDDLAPAEEAWARRLEDKKQLTRIADEPGNGPARAILDACFNEQAQAPNARNKSKTKANATTKTKEKASKHLGIFTPGDLEEHAHGIAIRVHEWLEQGVTPVNIVTQDRRLARRVHAVLANRNIVLRDRSGWALSTSVSAAAVNQLIDDADPAERLLRFARSAAVAWPDEYHSDNFPVAADIERVLGKEKQPATTWKTLEKYLNKSQSEATISCMRVVRDAMRPLEEVQERNADLPYEDYFAALEAAMNTLGMGDKLQADMAGRRIMDYLAEMRLVSRNHQASGTWTAWRNYLNHLFETTDFLPETQYSDVNLLTLRQARLSYSRGLALAGLDTQHAGVSRSSLLTELTAHELGLEERDVLIQRQLRDYRRLMENTEHTLISYEADSQQNAPPLPWVDVLRGIHELEGTSLLDNDLLRQARQAIRATGEPMEQPDAPPRMPAPTNDKPELTVLSHRACKSVIDCPYKFFASHVLRLNAEKPRPDGVIDHVTFGSKVHKCMHTLIDDPKYKTAFQKEWAMASKHFAPEELKFDSAYALAEKVVQREFSDSLKFSYANIYYSRLAVKIVCDYIDWLFVNVRVDDSTRFLSEFEFNEALDDVDDLTLKGRVDLAVINDQTKAHTIDYKTGNSPSTYSAMSRGEDIQLTFYALLEIAGQATYLHPEKHRSLSLNAKNNKKNLGILSDRLRELIKDFKSDYDKSLPMPAYGRDEVCEYCDYEGLCRKQMWRDTPLEPSEQAAQATQSMQAKDAQPEQAPGAD